MMEASFNEDGGSGIELSDIYSGGDSGGGGRRGGGKRGGGGNEVAMSANPLAKVALGGEWVKKWDKSEQCHHNIRHPHKRLCRRCHFLVG